MYPVRPQTCLSPLHAPPRFSSLGTLFSGCSSLQGPVTPCRSTRRRNCRNCERGFAQQLTTSIASLKGSSILRHSSALAELKREAKSQTCFTCIIWWKCSFHASPCRSLQSSLPVSPCFASWSRRHSLHLHPSREPQSTSQWQHKIQLKKSLQ